MKKFSLSFVLFAILLLSGCGQVTGDKVLMDELNNDGFYHYTNIGLGFGVYLPSKFEYYHVQRKNIENYVDIEIFVPTADTSYYQEIQSYAKPIVIRIWDKKYWDEMVEDEDKAMYLEQGRNRKQVYTVKFWETTPNDWEEIWNEEMKQSILNRFETY